MFWDVSVDESIDLFHIAIDVFVIYYQPMLVMP